MKKSIILLAVLITVLVLASCGITSTIEIQSPAGGELIQTDSSTTIECTVGDELIASVDIVLMRGETEVGTIAEEAAVAEDGTVSHTWDLSADNITEYYVETVTHDKKRLDVLSVKISGNYEDGATGAPQSTTSNTFAIVDPSTYTVKFIQEKELTLEEGETVGLGFGLLSNLEETTTGSGVYKLTDAIQTQISDGTLEEEEYIVVYPNLQFSETAVYGFPTQTENVGFLTIAAQISDSSQYDIIDETVIGLYRSQSDWYDVDVSAGSEAILEITHKTDGTYELVRTDY